MDDNYIDLNGINIHYHEYPSDGETIIFLHFGFSSLAMWNGVIPFFEEKYKLILPDFRGHGLSDKPKSTYHIDEMADDINLLMEKLNLEEAHFVGSSLGAELAVSIAARYPNKVLSLVVEGSAMNNAYGSYGLSDPTEEEKAKENEELMKHVRASEVYYDSPEEMLKVLKDNYEPKGFWNDQIRIMAEYEIYKTPEGKYSGTVPLWVSESYLKQYTSFKFEDYYKQIKIPVLFMPGDKEWENERLQNALNHFRGYLSDSKMVHVKGGMHAYVWLFFPEECSKHVLQFLQEMKDK
ncbi:MAG: alpha/beta fold hydrolase [Candidatus Heimdallarchaeaceae archaeon]